jgi:hypothetical protein
VAAPLRGCSAQEEEAGATVSIAITDARPALPEHVVGCRVTIEQVRVRDADGTWVPLEMARTPYTIDLLQVTEGRTAELVPAQTVPAGTYNAVRLTVSRAVLHVEDLDAIHDVEVTVPPENRSTESPIDLDLAAEPDADLTVDFDLSRSIAAEGPAIDPAYTLRPVLHLVESGEAATIQGTIAAERFSGEDVEITVAESDGRPYTRVRVPRDPDGDPAEYVISWVVPGATYQVLLNTQPSRTAAVEASATVETEAGEVYDVNF